ncbi:hypothetical protein JG687_00002954 [Phytophthora cactorum]|uniref:Uncharacterized protein n=2 Tax=Phytophthora cactorum TaxID=29920 RepID=A0A8T1UVJ0_9STRA|nr:hypothetical protein GQ600_18602 [Phytophthora cactorum]KAG6969875.1 hypothetical protein JG687_00002954 [Phytophthora cactorum]
MQSQILSCASRICSDACEAQWKCQWWCKVLTCLESSAVNIYEIGSHEVQGMDPPSGKLTVDQKKQVRELAADGMNPARIRNALSFNVPEDKIPHLNKVQTFVTHFRKTELNNTEDLDMLAQVVKDKAYTSKSGQY